MSRSELTIDQAKSVYRAAIDAGASDCVGADWWADVVCEVRQVCAAHSVKAAASVIEWWHHDWRMVGDTAKDAASRIRAQAKKLPRQQSSGGRLSFKGPR